jgi:MoaA/NifB/PqqE/SkfB family radical SAM enzyme
MNKRIDIKLGYQCNNFCRFCIVAPKRNKFPNKSAKEVKDILRKKRNECNRVIFMGGEPTLQESLIDYVKYAKDLNYEEIHITSNGRLFSLKDYCRKLCEAGANVFTVSIHGSNAKIHDYLTRAESSWSQSVKGIKNLKKINQRIQTNTVIVKQNYRNLPPLAKMLVALGVDKYQFAFMHISPIIQENPRLIKEIVPRYFQVESYVKKGLQIGIDSDVKTTTEAIPYCFMKGYESHISEKTIPDTDVYDMGITQRNFGEIRKTQAKARGPNCRKCKYDTVCEGPWKDYPEIFGWDEFKPVK